MKYSIICLFFLIIASCKQNDTTPESSNDNTAQKETTQSDDQFFGENFDVAIAKDFNYAQDVYADLKPGDTIQMTFQSKVNSVCKMKGCWMRLELPDGSESLVRFKDYGFFVPKDIENQTATVHGKAFVKETSVEDLKHYAKDASQSEEDVAAITEPQLTNAFEADGVYLNKVK